MLSDNQIRSFYEHVDRDNTYTIETDPDKHPFSPLLKDFIDKWSLRNKKVLEIGSAKGLFQDFVVDYTGVDVAERLGPYYRKPYVIVKDALLPFADGHFDAVFTYATHEHIPDIATALEEIIRVLRPGGVCLFAPAWHTRPWFAQGYAVRPYSELSLRERFIKFSIPLRDFFPLRWTFVLLRRIFRLLLFSVSPHAVPLRYRELKANYDKFWQSDSDACNSLDPFDIILWFRSRKFICHGYENLLKALFVRTFALELQRPS